eukprot:CAMPEP_0205802526 /NCGR_PEP_ID=MMETSP0205-20121125/4885_1 /ASSEMBLY_ACC=CAM_ASM_000278 /TAXON_ID=36767 /ORGANISM="Euplotes focardii, Strain TN1" /LENGTH=149 /DNA_ID=CAMNT_0053069103 /DNA_START=15 /DNA_END=461 /DNA_ORIENTATION=-
MNRQTLDVDQFDEKYFRSSGDTSFESFGRKRSQMSVKNKYENSHLNQDAFGKRGSLYSPGKELNSPLGFREKDKKVQNLDKMRESQYFDDRPITYRDRMDGYEPIPRSYKDILTARENNVRLSCPREIKPDPKDIDASMIMPKKMKLVR